MSRIDNMTAGSWSREEIAVAARWWSTGISGLQIAKKMNKTRSSIIGLANRNRGLFPARPKGYGFTSRYKEKSLARPVARVARNWTAEAGDRTPPLATELNIVPLPFTRISRGRCMFPMPDSEGKDGPNMLCCGMPSMDRYALPGDRKASNCEMHYRIGNSAPRVSNRA